MISLSRSLGTSNRNNMVDVFGDNNSFQMLGGSSGPAGPRGRSGIIDLCKWMPNTVLKNLQELEEEGCFVIIDQHKDIKRNKKTGDIEEWISRSHNKINLIGKTPTKDIIELPNGYYALVFHKNHYFANLLDILDSSYGFLCVTFRTESLENQTLISTYNPDIPEQHYNEILVSASTITIDGFNKDLKLVNVSIQHDCRQWSTLFVVRKNIISGSFMVNNDETSLATFTFKRDVSRAKFIDVGCRGNLDNNPFIGSISALELYSTFEQQDLPPKALKDLVINNQLIEI